MSQSRGRRRKLLLGSAACAVFLAVCLGFLLAPEGGEANPVKISLQGFQTNAAEEIFARLSVSNTTKHAVCFGACPAQVKSNGEWPPLQDLYDIDHWLQDGETETVLTRLPSGDSSWRLPILWFVLPARMKSWREQLRRRATALAHGQSPLLRVPQIPIHHTNFSGEFPR